MRIASYNAENFFDSMGSNRKPAVEVAALGRVIDRLGADIIAFQEVESARSLEELNDRLRTPFEFYALIEGNSTRDINLGFMSRFNFFTTSHRDVRLRDETGRVMRDFQTKRDFNNDRLSTVRFQRDLLLGEFDLGGGRSVAVFNVHYKSRRRRERWQIFSSNEIRAAEARATRTIVRRYTNDHASEPVVLLGDLNNTSGHASIRPVLRDLGFADVVRREVGPNATTFWSNARDRIDYILLSEVAENAYVDGSGAIHDSDTARSASDHLPVTVDLDL